MKNYWSLLCLVFLVWNCGSPESDAVTDTATNDSVAVVDPGEVNVYTHRHYEIDKTLFAEFEAATGIKVNVQSAKADELMARIEREGVNCPADLLITVDAARLVKAKDRGLLQPLASTVLEVNIPPYLRDPEGYWFAQTVRGRIVVYAKDRVDPTQLTTYEDLADPKWKGKVLLRSSSNVYNQSLMASIIAHNGSNGATEWATALVSNFARDPKGKDRDQVEAIAAGEGDLAIVNTYYIGKMLNSEDPEEVKVAESVGVFFPNQKGRGAHINISGAGVCVYAPNKDNAQKLLEWLSAVEQQKRFAEGNFEYPAHPGAPNSDLLNSWGDFKRDQLNLTELGLLNGEAVSVFDAAGWQ